MDGTLYGVGVGPGDPGFLTLKAVRMIESSEVLAVPVSDRTFKEPVYEEAGQGIVDSKILENCTAYQIILPEIPKAQKKAKLYLPMPMIKEKELLKQVHDACAGKIADCLRSGKRVAFLTLGDPTVYSTYLYVHRRIQAMGFKTRIIPGIPSFCAAAAKLQTGLAENKEQLHVIPASYDIEEALKLPGTKVLMKAGRKMADVKQSIKRNHLKAQMVENCGMETERIYHDTEEIPDEAGYYSLIIIKEED